MHAKESNGDQIHEKSCLLYLKYSPLILTTPSTFFPIYAEIFVISLSQRLFLETSLTSCSTREETSDSSYSMAFIT